MSNGEDYQRECKTCHKQITMSVRSGKWGPYDGNEFHNCQAVQGTPEVKEPQPQQQPQQKITPEDEKTVNEYLENTKAKTFDRHMVSLCEILYGNSDEVQKQYRTLTNQVRKHLGKVHGSQHTPVETEGQAMHYICVYFEVPKDAVKEYTSS